METRAAHDAGGIFARPNIENGITWLLINQSKPTDALTRARAYVLYITKNNRIKKQSTVIYEPRIEMSFCESINL